MKVVILCFLLISSLWSCNPNGKEIVVYKKNQLIPQLLVADPSLLKSGQLFAQLFLATTGIPLPVNMKKRNNSQQEIMLQVKSGNGQNIPFQETANGLSITGHSIRQLEQAIIHFFSVSTKNFSDISSENYSLNDSIIVPIRVLNKRFDFDYREPYFPANNNLMFRNLNATQTLEEEWGLWGHNIHKFIAVTPGMYAVVNGKTEKDQFNFSSDLLEEALEVRIKNALISDPDKNKFVIMPNDNAIVCMCDKCLELGNTEGDASNTVAYLLNRLAKKFPKAQFFTSDYGTTRNLPRKSLEKNVGVIISTMDFPKGIVYQGSKYEEEVGEKFDAWSKKTSLIYVWHYAVNFDNYLDAYPTLLVDQQNFDFFKKKGVSGLFIHGNETDYSAFEHLKTFLYAQLMQNTTTDLIPLIQKYCEANYQKYAKPIANYYIEINKRALNNKNQLDIYSGLEASKKKYLTEQPLFDLLKTLQDIDKNTTNTELQKIKISLLFQALELRRTNGFERNGYANYNMQNQSYAVKKETLDELKTLKELVEYNRLAFINEQKLYFQTYFEQWQQILLSHPYQNLITASDISYLSKPDEDYPNPQLLADGNFGFTDYNNNWLISAKNDLKINIKLPAKISGKRILGISFLHDLKHKIQAPQQVSISTTSTPNPMMVAVQKTTAPLQRIQMNIPILLTDKDEYLQITIPRIYQQAIACDEIIIN